MTLPLVQRSHLMRRKFSQAAEPTRCDAFDCSVWPSRYLAKSFSQAAMLSSCDIVSKPKLRHVSSRTFDDEGRAVGREAIGVRPDPAVLGLLEREGEGVEDLRRAEPDELVGANVDVDSECLRRRVAEARVGAVRGDDEIVVAPLGIGGIAFGIEVKHDAELARAILQDFEQALAADADEAVAARGDRSRRGSGRRCRPNARTRR